MMIFNSFTVANDYKFGAQWPNGRGRRFILPTNKTFKGICLDLAGKRSRVFVWYLKSFCKKRLLNLVLSLFINKSTKWSNQARLRICKQKTFPPVSSINSSRTKTKHDLLKLPNRTSSPSLCISGTACLIICEISLFVTAGNPEGILLATYASLTTLGRRNWRWIND